MTAREPTETRSEDGMWKDAVGRVTAVWDSRLGSRDAAGAGRYSLLSVALAPPGPGAGWGRRARSTRSVLRYI